MINNRKRIIIISALGAAAVAAAAMCIMMTSRIRGGNPTGEALSQNINPIEAASQTEEPTVYVDNTVDIIDVNSKTSVLHASYSSCASWRTAAAACSTSCSVFVCEKLNRTTPCSTVPNTLCINGAQCAPARTQMP